MPTAKTASSTPSSTQSQPFDLVGRILVFMRWDQAALDEYDTHRHQGPRRKLQTWQLIVGLIAHCLPMAGRFSKCMQQYFGMTLSDAALSQRRQRLGPDLFTLIMEETLRPLADAALHPGCFLGALRLVGIDGTTWSVSNTSNKLPGKQLQSLAVAAFWAL